MTERGARDLNREASRLEIGPSSMTWAGDRLEVAFQEISAPVPRRLKGKIVLRPQALTQERFDLDPDGRHRWRPYAPRAEVEVVLEAPELSWTGSGYFDSNWGCEPLERAFSSWNWSRVHAGSDSFIFYDVGKGGGGSALSLRLTPGGGFERIEAPAVHRAPSTFWRMSREVRADTSPTLVRTLEDAPFYSRSEFRGACFGRPAEMVHESISLRRLRSPLVRAMLPFRMPRRFL